MASTIGIKIANGEFYSIMDENSIVKKRLVLTTVHDNQRSVQIDLYKSFTKTMADALYIGSLVVEKIKPRPKGEPSVEMVISSTGEGDITADAIDLDNSTHGEHHYLNVSLKSLDEDNREYEIPDFELEQHEGPPAGLYEQASMIKKEEETREFPWVVVLIVGLAIILICLVLWFFLIRSKGASEQQKSRAPVESTATQAPRQPAAQPAPSPPAASAQPAQPAAPAQPAPPAQPAAAPQPASPPPVIQAPPASPQTAARPAVNRARPPAPVSSYKVPDTIPKDGAPYKIRWGDTLWDISEAFYRNPWLYPRIARFNNIRNPDRIISGTTIRIPPKN